MDSLIEQIRIEHLFCTAAHSSYTLSQEYNLEQNRHSLCLYEAYDLVGRQTNKQAILHSMKSIIIEEVRIYGNT